MLLTKFVSSMAFTFSHFAFSHHSFSFASNELFFFKQVAVCSLTKRCTAGFYVILFVHTVFVSCIINCAVYISNYSHVVLGIQGEMHEHYRPKVSKLRFYINFL